MTLKRSFWVLMWSVIGLCAIAPFLWGAFWFVLLMSAGDESTLLVDKTYQVGGYVVHETIHKDGFGWPDHRMLRQYSVLADKNYPLGDYDNESTQGISLDTPPQMVGDWLVVFSSNHIYLWQPGQEPIEFYPYDAENWHDVFPGSLSAPNGHYDYAAKTFSIAEVEGENRWLITYRCIVSSCRCADTVCGSAPGAEPNLETLTFYSDDEGESFYLLPPG